MSKNGEHMGSESLELLISQSDVILVQEPSTLGGAYRRVPLGFKDVLNKLRGASPKPARYQALSNDFRLPLDHGQSEVQKEVDLRQVTGISQTTFRALGPLNYEDDDQEWSGLLMLSAHSEASIEDGIPIAVPDGRIYSLGVSSDYYNRIMPTRFDTIYFNSDGVLEEHRYDILPNETAGQPPVTRALGYLSLIKD